MTDSHVPLLLLHAFPLNARMWQEQVTGLPELRTLTVDLYGRLDAEPSVDVMARLAAERLDAAGVERAVLGGLSMGGYVAMAFARAFPERVAGLLLADTKAVADTEAQTANRERIAQAVLARQSVRLLVDEQLPAPLLGARTPLERPELTAHVAAMMLEATPEAVAWAQRAMATRPDSFETLRGMDVPAAVVVGAEDTLTPVSDAEAMAEALPKAELTILQGAGHLSSLETPDSFNDTVRALFSRVA
ncbi:alpha/beta fold hydrolase [Streptacidiphilus monticola]|uniref:Alpha/beta fold hydrolase n=1 Tax=Streptacidiphilus monticola TaxID=2161674 RepID=A0ABW1G7X1_9ACTN